MSQNVELKLGNVLLDTRQLYNNLVDNVNMDIKIGTFKKHMKPYLLQSIEYNYQ